MENLKTYILNIDEVAGASPIKLLLYPFFFGFWLISWRFFSLALISLISVIFLSGYIFDPRQGRWAILSVAAIFIALIGFLHTFYELAKLEIEDSLLFVIKRDGQDYNNNDKRQVELNELLEEISVKNKTKYSPAMNRLIKHVVEEAKSIKFDSGVNLIQPYKEEALDIIFTLQNFQKIALWVGIGGTFIGILKAMRSENLKKIFENPEGINEIIPFMFDNLVISFSASLAGLVSAIILGGLILLIRNKQQNYFQKMEEVISIITSAARKSTNKGKFLSQLDLLKEDIKKNQIFTGELQKSISLLQQNIITQNENIHQSVNSFISSNQRLSDVSQKVEEEMKNVHNAAALKTTLHESIQTASQQMSKEIAQQVTLLTNQINGFRQTAKSFEETIQKHSKQTSQLNKSTNSRLQELAVGIKNLRFIQGGFWGFIDRVFNNKK